MKSLQEMDHYELLEVSRDADGEEIERAYALVSAAYQPDSLASYSVFDSHESGAIRARVEAAYAVLSDPDSRLVYDTSLPPGGEVDASEDEPLSFEPVSVSAAEAPRAEPTRSRPEIGTFEDSDAIDEDAPWDGARLRRSRMLRGADIEAIAAFTKINPAYLRCLEEERFDDLPAPVYVRGFVSAYARYLGLDARRVSASYVERFEEARNEHSRGRFLGRR